MNTHTISNLTSLMMIRHKVIFVGDVNVGKTAVLNRITDTEYKCAYEVILL